MALNRCDFWSWFAQHGDDAYRALKTLWASNDELGNDLNQAADSFTRY